MINEKYYNDIKKFPDQFKEGFALAQNVRTEGVFKDVTLCGMGGSSYFVSLLNDILSIDSSLNLQIKAVKGYDLPAYRNKDNVYLISSYSGNTEEVLSFYKQIISTFKFTK